MNKLIVRHKYLDIIRPYIGKQIIKVLTGQRRVGKSYILFQTIEEIKQLNSSANILYINKEDFAFDTLKTAEDLYNYVLQNTKIGVKNYVFVDEIQEISDFEKVFRSLLLNSDYDLYCTGSNAYMLSGELASFLSGRYIEIPVYSLSYTEFLEFQNLDNTNETLHKYLKYGGLPYLKHLELQDEIVFNYLKGVYNTIIYKDLIQRYEIRNTVFLENLVKFLADNTGQIFSAKKISDYLKSQQIKISVSQVINYLQYLASSFLIRKVKRMDIAGKKIFEIGEKFYFEDLGLRHTINGYRLNDISKILENVVYTHLLFCGYEVKVGQIGNMEIDFVCERGGEKLYVQVSYLLKDQKTIEREFGNMLKINDNYPKILVSLDEFLGNTYKGIEHIHLRKFLTNWR